MKVLMFGWEFPPHISGGLGTACFGLTKGLATIDELDIIFVVPKAFGDEEPGKMRLMGAQNVMLRDFETADKEFMEKISFLEVDSPLVPYLDPEQYKEFENLSEKKQKFLRSKASGQLEFSGEYGTNLFSEIHNYAIVSSVIAMENEFDLIHAHDWLTYPAGIAAKEASSKPLIIHVHATDFDRSGGSVNPEVFKIEKMGMEAADKIITVSNLTRKTVIEKYGINPDKITTVYNAVDPITPKVNIRRGVDDKIVTFLGRITLQKGPEYFIEAAYKVLQRMDNVRFVMAGSGDMMDKMISRVAELEISDKFHFTGFLRGEDVYNMFGLSDLYIMPSVSEPFGISPLEALFANVPVIISHQSGVSEILKHAIKIDFWDIDAMANAIYGILNYEALPKMFKKHGKTEVEQLKWENSAKAVKLVYDEFA